MSTASIVVAWLAVGGCLAIVSTAVMVVAGLAWDARRTREQVRRGCGRDACGQGCNKRGGDGPPLRSFDSGVADAYVRGGMTLREVRQHFGGSGK